MLQVNRVRELVAEVKAAIPQIKYAEVLTTDDDFKKFLVLVFIAKLSRYLVIAYLVV